MRFCRPSRKNFVRKPALVRCVESRIQSAPRVVPIMSRLLSWERLLIVASAVCAGCPAAPLDGKSCPCTSDYFCCTPTQSCTLKIEKEKCRCPSVPLTSRSVTTNGAPLPGEPLPDAATDGQLIFGDPPERWASYVFKGIGEAAPSADVPADRDGFHFTATFADGVPDADAYEGFGLSYDSASCIDGTSLRGVQFEVTGDLGGKRLTFSVTSANQVTPVSDPRRGICQGTMTTCYGANNDTSVLPQVPTPVSFLFSDLMGGTAGPASAAAQPGSPAPGTTVDVTQIVNVQWMVHASADPRADFTIRNVSFF
jgi:hypothetical protein